MEYTLWLLSKTSKVTLFQEVSPPWMTWAVATHGAPLTHSFGVSGLTVEMFQHGTLSQWLPSMNNPSING